MPLLDPQIETVTVVIPVPPLVKIIEVTLPGYSGFSGYSGSGGSGVSGYSGFCGAGTSGYSGYSGLGFSGESGYSGFSGVGFSGGSGYSGFSSTSGYSGFCGTAGASGQSGYSGFCGTGTSGFSGYSGQDGAAAGSGYSGFSGKSGYSGFCGLSGYSGFCGTGTSGFSGYSGFSGKSGYSGFSGPSLLLSTTQTDTDYTLALVDAQTCVKMSSSSAHNLTVPPNGTIAFDIGAQIVIEQAGTATVTIVAGVGVTLQGVSTTSGQYSQVVLLKQASDTWLVAGGMSGYSGYSGFCGLSGYSGFSGKSGYSGFCGLSGYSGFCGLSGYSGFCGLSGYSGFCGLSGYSGFCGLSGYSGFCGLSGYSGFSSISGYSGFSGTGSASDLNPNLQVLTSDYTVPDNKSLVLVQSITLSNNVDLIVPSTGYVQILTSKTDGTDSFAPVKATLAANFVTAGFITIDIPGLSAPVAANTFYSFEVDLVGQPSDTAGIQFQVNCNPPAGAIGYYLECFLTSSGSASTGIHSFGVNTASMWNTAVTNHTLKMTGNVLIGTTGGRLVVRVLKVTSGTATINTGSTLVVTKRG